MIFIDTLKFYRDTGDYLMVSHKLISEIDDVASYLLQQVDEYGHVVFAISNIA